VSAANVLAAPINPTADRPNTVAGVSDVLAEMQKLRADVDALQQNVPEDLKATAHWVGWKYELRPGAKPPYKLKDITKPPHCIATPHRLVNAHDPKTWATFSQAVSAVDDVLNNTALNGPGFSFADTDLVGIDLDGFVQNGVLSPYGRAIQMALGHPYGDISPSETGGHLIFSCPGLNLADKKHVFKSSDREHYAIEIYNRTSTKYFTMTGRLLSGAGAGVPTISPTDFAPVYTLISLFENRQFMALWETEKFRRLWFNDEPFQQFVNGVRTPYASPSETDQALCTILANAVGKNKELIDPLFRLSELGRSRAARWNNGVYAECTLNKACSSENSPAQVSSGNKKSEERGVLEFHHFPTEEEKATWTPCDYAIAPIAATKHNFDGWFPLGNPSLIGGSSGSGKTTFILDMCITQQMKAPFFKHPTFGRPFLVLMLDRGTEAHQRTMLRLGFSEAQVPIRFLRPVVDRAASQEIINQIESDPNNIPQILFIDGMDMLVSDPNAMQVVMPFLNELQQIAAHFHIAIIGACGAPKTKGKEGYAAKRDTVFGSAVWSRMSETIVTVQFPGGDDTAEHRVVSVQPRNNKAETLYASFEMGRLVETPQPQEAEKHVSPKVQAARDFLRRELKDGPKVGKELQAKAHRTENIQRAMIYDAAKWLHVNTEAGTVGEGREKQHLWQIQAEANDPQGVF
jgi:hypothetical protein